MGLNGFIEMSTECILTRYFLRLENISINEPHDYVHEQIDAIDVMVELVRDLQSED